MGLWACILYDRCFMWECPNTVSIWFLLTRVKVFNLNLALSRITFAALFDGLCQNIAMLEAKTSKLLYSIVFLFMSYKKNLLLSSDQRWSLVTQSYLIVKRCKTIIYILKKKKVRLRVEACAAALATSPPSLSKADVVWQESYTVLPSFTNYLISTRFRFVYPV